MLCCHRFNYVVSLVLTYCNFKASACMHDSVSKIMIQSCISKHNDVGHSAPLALLLLVLYVNFVVSSVTNPSGEQLKE